MYLEFNKTNMLKINYYFRFLFIQFSAYNLMIRFSQVPIALRLRLDRIPTLNINGDS